MAIEIRIRDASPELMKKVQTIRLHFREKQIPQAVIKLINSWQSDQAAIKQLQQRNTELHREINRYFSKETQMRDVIEGFATSAKSHRYDIDKVIQQCNRSAKLFTAKKRKK